MTTAPTRRRPRRHSPAEPRPHPATHGHGWGEDGPTAEELERERLWERLVAQGWRAEIVGGRIVVSPWTRQRQALLVDRVGDQLYAVKRERGWVFYQTWAVHIPPLRGDKRLPDLLVAPPDCPRFDDSQAYGHGTGSSGSNRALVPSRASTSSVIRDVGTITPAGWPTLSSRRRFGPPPPVTRRIWRAAARIRNGLR